MAIPTNREQFIDWCKRRLGWPVIDINMDDDQADDCVDEALQFFQDWHFDGTEKMYLKHQITSTDKTNQYISVTENILGIKRVFSLNTTLANVNMFDIRYQLRLHDLYDFTSASYVNYTITQQHLRMLDMLFVGEVPIRFNRHTDRLYIDWSWDKAIQEGEYIIVECYAIVDPDTYTDVWNDRLLKKYATALMKKQWGTNMKKFGNMQLPGGVTMNGQQIFDEAVQEIKDLEDEIVSTFSEPPQFLVG